MSEPKIDWEASRIIGAIEAEQLNERKRKIRERLRKEAAEGRKQNPEKSEDSP